MPELPEVETVRLGLKPALEGRILASVLLRRAGLRLPFPPLLKQRLEGRRVRDIGRRGKYLLIRMDEGLTLIVHLGMSGRFSVHSQKPPPPGKHDHVTLLTDQGAAIYFHDPRRFGLMELVEDKEIDSHPLFARMGPEPLSDALNGIYLKQRLQGRRGAIKPALLDQRLVAGIGNIYASEILYRCGISPLRQASAINKASAKRLASAIKEVLGEAIQAGGATLRDHRAPNGEPGDFQRRLAVYGRAGEPCPDCRCNPGPGGGIMKIVQGGRSTFYCPHRQR